MKKWFLSLLIQFLIYAPYTQAWAAEQPINIRDLLLKVTSTVTDQEFGSYQLQSFSSQYPSTSPQQLSASVLSSSSVQSYFPLNNNDTKQYSGTVYGTQYSTTMSYSAVNFNGKLCFQESDSLDGSIAYYSHNSSQLEMHGVMVDGLDFTFNTPLVILNDSILINDGSLQSSTSLVVEGFTLTVNLTVNSTSVGSVSTPLGTIENSRTIDMSYSYIFPGESDTLDLREVWVLGPGVGKIKIALVDQDLKDLGWMTINGGIVAGQTVNDIISKDPFTMWYWDNDGDGYGAPAIAVESISQPSGYVLDNTDCEDNNENIHPGASEIRGDGIDQDCNGNDSPTFLIQTQVSQLYVSIFGRVSEGEGNAYWQSEQSDMTVAAEAMLNTEPAKAYFGDTLNDNQMFIEFIYKNTLGKTYAEDPTGVIYWVSELAVGKSKGEVVASLINAAMDPQYSGFPAQEQFINKVTISNYTADNIPSVPDVNDLSAFVGFISNVTYDSTTVVDAKAAVDAFSYL